jgi:hypothetical protein
LLQPDEREKLERGFKEAEASTFLSGLTLSENYFKIKGCILSGEITFDQGQEEILAYHRVKKSSVDQPEP